MPFPLTLKELEKKIGAASEVPPEVLEHLQSDSRAGCQRLYRQLKNRIDRQKLERARMEGMFRFERKLWQAGVRRVAGVDEVGIGPMAGPVVAAAVVFSPGAWIDGIDDSKRLDADRREVLDSRIRETAAGIGLGVVSSGEVDRLNVYHAGLRAMQRAVEALSMPPEHVLVDSRTIPDIPQSQSSFIKGDSRSFSIAAASIVAKVYRDALMCDMGHEYPGYGFAGHKGYPTKEHQEAVRKWGPSPIHRRSYNFIKELRGEFSMLFYDILKQAEVARSPSALETLRSRLNASRTRLSASERRKLYLVVRRCRSRLRP
jgi:ribonuclease HII